MNFENYYVSQAKENLPIFRGAPFQRGYGFGGVFKVFLGRFLINDIGLFFEFERNGSHIIIEIFD